MSTIESLAIKEFNPRDFFNREERKEKEKEVPDESSEEEVENTLMKRPQIIQRRVDTITTKEKLKYIKLLGKRTKRPEEPENLVKETDNTVQKKVCIENESKPEV